MVLFAVVGDGDGGAVYCGGGGGFGGAVDFYFVLGPPGGVGAFGGTYLYCYAGGGNCAGEFEAQVVALLVGVAGAVIEVEAAFAGGVSGYWCSHGWIDAQG